MNASPQPMIVCAIKFNSQEMKKRSAFLQSLATSCNEMHSYAWVQNMQQREIYVLQKNAIYH